MKDLQSYINTKNLKMFLRKNGNALQLHILPTGWLKVYVGLLSKLLYMISKRQEFNFIQSRYPPNSRLQSEVHQVSFDKKKM